MCNAWAIAIPGYISLIINDARTYLFGGNCGNSARDLNCCINTYNIIPGRGGGETGVSVSPVNIHSQASRPPKSQNPNPQQFQQVSQHRTRAGDWVRIGLVLLLFAVMVVSCVSSRQEDFHGIVDSDMPVFMRSLCVYSSDYEAGHVFAAWMVEHGVGLDEAMGVAYRGAGWYRSEFCSGRRPFPE